MAESRSTTSGAPAGSVTAYRELQRLMGDIRLDLGVWAPDGSAILPWAPCCEFTATLEQAGAEVAEACRSLAVKAAAQGRALTETTWTGCCVVAVPARRRRRIVAGVAASFPVSRMLEEESLARLCARLELDNQAIARQGRQDVRLSAEQAEVFLAVVQGALESLQAKHEADEDIQTFSRNLATTYEELSLLYRVSGSMLVSRQPEEFIRNVCDELLEVMSISAAAAIACAHPPAIEEDITVVSGTVGLPPGQLSDLVRREIAPRLIAGGQPLLSNRFAAESPTDPDGLVRTVMAMPLSSDEETIGVLVGLNKVGADFDSIDMKLMSAIASQTSVFLANNRLYADLQDLLMGVLHALTATIDAKDPYTSGHSHRVALISRRLAEECGFGPDKVQQVYLAGLLHDIGKIGVPEAILRKKGRLTPEEYDDMKRHPMLGANILGGIRQLDEVIVGILTHHERPDGKGYPRGLRGDQIPVEGRIIGIADGFDAMSSHRTYRSVLPLGQVIKELRTNSGAQFDGELVEKFLALDLAKFMEEIHQPARTVFPFVLHQERTP